MDIGQSLFGTGTNPLGQNNLQGVGSLITVFLNVVFALAGIILIFFFVIGGIGMIAGAGQNDPQKAESAKKTATSAVIGFIIVFTSFWIVQFIAQLLGLQGTIVGTLFGIK